MPKFTLRPDPTFRRKVAIPIPGEDKEAQVEFVFKFRTREQLAELYEALGNRDRAAMVMEMATGWELADPFTEDNVRLLDSTYIGSLERVVAAYWEEHTKALEKN